MKPFVEKSQLEIVFLTTESGWRGGENQVFLLACHLASIGHLIHIIAPSESPFHTHERIQALGIATYSATIRSDIDIIGIRKLCQTLRQINSHGVSILHTQTARAHTAGLWAKAFGCCHRLIVHRRTDFPLKKSILNRCKYLSRHVSAYIAISNSIRKNLIAFGVDEKKVFVVSSCVDLSLYSNLDRKVCRSSLRAELGLNEDAQIVGIACHLTPEKDVSTFIRAAERCLKSKPQSDKMHFVIAGSGIEENLLKQYVTERSLEDRIHFLSHRSDLPQVMMGLDVFCLTSKYEGLGTVILEAFAAKVPVIATNTGGIPDMVLAGETGELFKVGDDEELARKITTLILQQDYVETYTHNAYEKVRRQFSYETLIRTTSEIYEKVLSKSISII